MRGDTGEDEAGGGVVGEVAGGVLKIIDQKNVLKLAVIG